MLDKFGNIFKVQELRDRVLFTLFIFLICRIGAHIPTPGINAEALGAFFQQSQNTLFGLYDMFTGGAFRKVAIFGLGIMPYISASIIIQLLGTTMPFLPASDERRRAGTQENQPVHALRNSVSVRNAGCRCGCVP